MAMLLQASYQVGPPAHRSPHMFELIGSSKVTRTAANVLCTTNSLSSSTPHNHPPSSAVFFLVAAALTYAVFCHGHTSVGQPPSRAGQQPATDAEWAADASCDVSIEPSRLAGPACPCLYCSCCCCCCCCLFQHRSYLVKTCCLSYRCCLFVDQLGCLPHLRNCCCCCCCCCLYCHPVFPRCCCCCCSCLAAALLVDVPS
jgi:hypothetical protein